VLESIKYSFGLAEILPLKESEELHLKEFTKAEG